MTFQIYEAADGWRWRLRARNGRTVADSGEAYASKANARRAIDRVRDPFKGAAVAGVVEFA